jgi:hypothetical protein
VLAVFQRTDVPEKLNDRSGAGSVFRCGDVERTAYYRYITIVICHSLPVPV